MNPIINAVEFAFNGAQTKRYHTVHTTKVETVGHHSHGVATIISILHPNCSKELLRAALIHDLDEHVFGDMPAPAKRELGIRSVLKEHGNALMEKTGIPIPSLSFWEHVKLEFADALQGALACLHEIKAGNTHVYGSLSNYIDYMQHLYKELDDVEVDMLVWIKSQATKYIELPKDIENE